jgi:fructokinase
MIICFGEILLDTFVDKNSKKETSFVGGAPFNVAYQAHMMSNNVLFVGNVGKDTAGKKIQKFFDEHDLDKRGLHVLADKKTLISKVTLDHAERSFTFERENSADDCFEDDALDYIQEGDLVHCGSFLLSTKKGRDYLDQILQFAKSQNKITSFDINYRGDIFADEKEAIDIYEKYYPNFDIVKFSKEELQLFTKEDDIEKGLKKLKKGPKLILVTLGKDGSIAYYRDKTVKAKSVKVNCVDTTGAGDAFYGTFLSNVDSIGLREMLFIPSLMESTLKFSNIAGALATTKKGALESIPSFKEVNKVLENNTFQK